MKLERKQITRKFSKWFHHMGTMRVVVKRSTGEMILVSSEDRAGPYWSIADSHALDVFIWLGRYLALKGKLPRHLSLDGIAVATQRASKDIRAVIATEHFDLMKRAKK